MAFIDEDKLQADIMARFKGRVVLACAAAAGVGFVLGAFIF
jgi:hypothetical protein